MKTLPFLLAVLIAVPAIAQDAYQHPPLRILTERLDEHDKQICDLDERVTQIEKNVSKLVEMAEADVADKAKAETAAADPVVTSSVKYDYDGAMIVPGSERMVETSRVVPMQPVVVVSSPSVTTATRTVSGPFRTRSRSVSTTSGTRLKTTAELRRDIAASRNGRTYGRMASGSGGQVWQHLIQTHGYTAAQVNGLSYRDATQLHNVAHGPKISPYTSGTAMVIAAPVETFVPTPRDPTPTPNGGNNYGNCANGQCARRSSGAARGGWFPGKLLFYR